MNSKEIHEAITNNKKLEVEFKDEYGRKVKWAAFKRSDSRFSLQGYLFTQLNDGYELKSADSTPHFVRFIEWMEECAPLSDWVEL